MKWLIVFFLLSLAGSCCGQQYSDEVRVCQHFNYLVCPSNNCSDVKVCEKPGEGKRSHCYAAWKNESGIIKVMHQSCWLDHFDCYKSQCIATQIDRKTQTLFCCCDDNMCNVNFTYQPKPDIVILLTTAPAPTVTVPDSEDITTTLMYSLLPILGLAFVVSLLFWIWRYFNCRESYDLSSLTDPLMAPEGQIDVMQSKPPDLMDEVIATGRYGCVRKAKMGDKIVAVKILPCHQKSAWQREKDIYRLPGLSAHENILLFYAALLQDTDLWLVTEFHKRGSLCDFLKENIVNWSQLLTICCSMLDGLSFLHEETTLSDGKRKPAIAHRDFKSKNVLLKDDLTACIADFGLAIAFDGLKMSDVHTQAGTRRYMAPEVLELAMCFDRNAFLHVDMYACALVIWEVMSRCSLNGETVGDYLLPYEKEVGMGPSLDKLVEVVCKQGQRPAIENKWRDAEEVSLLVSTLEELWDRDPEARLSASCVIERLRELSASDSVVIDMTHLNVNQRQISSDNARHLADKLLNYKRQDTFVNNIHPSIANRMVVALLMEHTADSGVHSAGEDNAGTGSTQSDSSLQSSDHLPC